MIEQPVVEMRSVDVAAGAAATHTLPGNQLAPGRRTMAGEATGGTTDGAGWAGGSAAGGGSRYSLITP